MLGSNADFSRQTNSCRRIRKICPASRWIRSLTTSLGAASRNGAHRLPLQRLIKHQGDSVVKFEVLGPSASVADRHTGPVQKRAARRASTAAAGSPGGLTAVAGGGSSLPRRWTSRGGASSKKSVGQLVAKRRMAPSTLGVPSANWSASASRCCHCFLRPLLQDVHRFPAMPVNDCSAQPAGGGSEGGPAHRQFAGLARQGQPSSSSGSLSAIAHAGKRHIRVSLSVCIFWGGLIGCQGNIRIFADRTSRVVWLGTPCMPGAFQRE